MSPRVLYSVAYVNQSRQGQTQMVRGLVSEVFLQVLEMPRFQGIRTPAEPFEKAFTAPKISLVVTSWTSLAIPGSGGKARSAFASGCLARSDREVASVATAIQFSNARILIVPEISPP